MVYISKNACILVVHNVMWFITTLLHQCHRRMVTETRLSVHVFREIAFSDTLQKSPVLKTSPNPQHYEMQLPERAKRFCRQVYHVLGTGRRNSSEG